MYSMKLKIKSKSNPNFDERKVCWESRKKGITGCRFSCTIDAESPAVNWVFYLGDASSQEEAWLATPAKAANYIFHLDKNGGFLPMLLIIMSGI